MTRLAVLAVMPLLLAVALAASGCRRDAVRLPPGAPIVLVVVDTLRADGLGVYGYGRATSSLLDGWARQGAVFDRAFTTSPWTLPSVGSLFTGRYPASHGSGRAKIALPSGRSRRVFTSLDASMPRLAGILSAAGYDTAAFVTNTFLRPGFGLAEGFDTYDHTRNRFLERRRADVMVDHALAWIDGREPGAPWLLVLHLLDPHQPYDPPAEDAGRFTSEYVGELEAPIGLDSGLVRRVKRGQLVLGAEDRAFVRGVYDEEVAFVARQVARLLEGLESRAVLERGLVVLTADHGEEFFDHGALEHGHTMYQELLRIPFVVWGHGVRSGRRAEPVSLVDVLPTLLDAAGIALPDGLDGVSLWPLLTGTGELAEPRQLVAENSLYGQERLAIVEWPWKLIVNRDRPEVELYDLERDPGESENLAAARPEVTERLAAALEERRLGATVQQPVELDAETRRELRALGYLR
ncbi:MAG TPA: sulfatase [Thermoanaerobaculia bacterium]|nr:sulfatase [Thermoanaerobaculia bacterium]